MYRVLTSGAIRSFTPDGGSMETAVDNRRNSVDVDYMNMMGIKLIAGRQFSDNREMEIKVRM
ncbi:MAG: hypothetical protein WDN75_21590 [Bacteroidota bacterium]